MFSDDFSDAMPYFQLKEFHDLESANDWLKETGAFVCSIAVTDVSIIVTYLVRT